MQSETPPPAVGERQAPVATARLDGHALYTALRPNDPEPFCAWFADRRDGVLYFGESAFWNTFRDGGGDPQADLALEGPMRIGRFDLALEQHLPAIEIGAGLSGVWDVLAHPNGRIYFTTFFQDSGYVDPETGSVKRFGDVGVGLNELTLGADGSILATRYGGLAGEGGSVVELDPEGGFLAEFHLPELDGFTLAGKSIAYDPVRGEVWVNTDRLPERQASGPQDHPTLVLDAAGEVVAQIDDVEIHFMVFGRDGTGYAAFVEGSRLWLARLAPGASRAGLGDDRTLLDERFPGAHDFVQDLRISQDGRVIATRWSGLLHIVVPRPGEASELVRARLPDFAPIGLYYTTVFDGSRLCATFCADVSIVCGPQP